MSASHWKIFGEKIAGGMGEKTLRRLSTGAKVLGRTGAVVGIGFLAYELYKNYRENIENEPVYREMMILQAELEKWMSAVSCLGGAPSAEKEYGSLNEGGAINALHRKIGLKGQGVKAADPKEAYTLIGRSMNYIRRTENLLGDDQFDEKRKTLISQLRGLQLQISKVDDYRPIQKKLGKIVAEIKSLAAGYSSRTYDCSREIQKNLGSNAAWAAISMTTLGLVQKPRS
jgi:hypothetical protein